MTLPGVPSEATEVLEAYLEGLDDALDGELVEVHLFGALALGDWVPDRSDLDLLVVRSCGYDDEVLDALRSVHGLVRDTLVVPRIEALYLTPHTLEQRPDEDARVPWYILGELGVATTFDMNPSTWLTLLDHPLTLRGQPRTRDNTWYDDDEIRAWNREQLDTYWRSYLHRASRPSLIRYNTLSDRGIEWAVLGPLRHLYTIATGRVISKLDAGAYGLEIFDERWHPLLEDAMRIRRGEYPPPGWHYRRRRRRRRRDAVSFLAEVVGRA